MSEQTVDLRRFIYPLEPVQRQQAWKLEALQLELSRAQQQRDEAQTRLQRLQAAQQEQTEHAALALRAQLNPASHCLSLAYLTQLQHQIQVMQQQLTEHQQAFEAAQQRYIAQHNRVDKLQEHKNLALREYTQGEHQRLSKEADSDWLARRQWQQVQKKEVLSDA